MSALERAFSAMALGLGLFGSSCVSLAEGPTELSSDAGSSGTDEPEPDAEGTSSTSSTTDPGSEPAEDATSGGSSGGEGDACDATSLARPTPRGEIEGVWDGERRRMVFFGGDRGTPVSCMSQTDFVAETWAFHPDCDTFERIETEVGPSARGRHAVAHDLARGRMIVHGGRSRVGTSGDYTLFRDTWALDLATDTWTKLSEDGPSARTNHAAVVSGDTLLVFGGNASASGLVFTKLDDLWALDLESSTWTALETSGGPSARLFHAAAVSDDGRTMFVYGGGDENAFTGPFFADLWALDLQSGTWTMLSDGGPTAPIGSIWGDLLFDASRNRLLLWGAHEDNLLGNNNKLWSWDVGEGGWTKLEEGDVQQTDPAGFCDFPVEFVAPDLDAPERRSAGAAVLTDDDELLVFGGKTDCGIIDDVWGYALQTGTWHNRKRATAGEICPRAFAEGCSTMCY